MGTPASNKGSILMHATKLFAKNGFCATSIREIAKAAGTTVRNIYYYFGSKEELYDRIIEATVNDFSAAIRNTLQSEMTLTEQLAAMTVAKYRFIDKNPDRMRIFFREWFAPERASSSNQHARADFLQALGGMIYMVRDRIARGEIGNVDPEQAAWLLLGIFNAFDPGFINLGLTPSEEEIKSIARLALAGIET